MSGSKQQARRKRILRAPEHTDDDGFPICHICRTAGSEETMEVDHVIPLSEDGPDTDDNCAPAHAVPCHRDKSAAEATRARARARA